MFLKNGWLSKYFYFFLSDNLYALGTTSLLIPLGTFNDEPLTRIDLGL